MTLTGLRSGSSYQVRVSLVNAVGTGTYKSVGFRTASRARVTTRTVVSGSAVTVSRTLSARPALRKALSRTMVTAVFDPAGSAKARAVATMKPTNTGTVTVRLVAKASGSVSFRYLVGRTWRTAVVQTIRVVPPTA